MTTRWAGNPDVVSQHVQATKLFFYINEHSLDGRFFYDVDNEVRVR
tara:strand:+ start:12345 stop:12482 length:138 start_codon:yes stop_codon:yes gene_type:complete